MNRLRKPKQIVILLLLTLTLLLTINLNFPTVKSQTFSIQEAINKANPGDTIIVPSGTYFEKVEINKTLTIIGENPHTTILDGSSLEYPVLMLITAHNVTLTNLTIKGASKPEHYGVLLSNTKNVNLKNLIIRENYRGIVLTNVTNSKISNTSIIKNIAYAITLRQNSNNNTFVNNTIIENPIGVSIEISCKDNCFYHNNFISNIQQVDPINYGRNTKWNSTTSGNYWSDYTGLDENGDRIGDTPYTKGGANDYLPLINPWGAIPPIAKFTFKPQIAKAYEKVTFNASESYDIDGKIENYTWDFGDGNITTVTNPTVEHIYTLCGNYTITFTVTDNDGLNDTATMTILIVQVKKKTSTLTISLQPQELEIGGNVTITGSLTIEGYPAVNENVTILKRKRSQTIWENLTWVTTNINGIYQHKWKPEDTGTYELVAIWQGNETTYPSNSTTVTLTVKKRNSGITIYAVPEEIYIGENITITGKITPAAEGLSITLEYQKIYSSTQFTTWKFLATVQTNSSGNYVYKWQPEEVAMYLFRAIWPGDDLTEGCSNYTGFVKVKTVISNITINVETQKIIVGANVTISGKISPPRSHVNVTISIISANGETLWKEEVSTELDGTFKVLWKAENSGTYHIKASWHGDAFTSGAESEILTLIVESPQKNDLAFILAFLGIAIFIAIFLWKFSRKS